MSYKRRPGTSGIRGHLYESKLLSLLLFRAQHDDNIEEFVLASNMDDLGVLDDICLKIKLKNHDRPIALFLQVKHRESNKQLSVNNTNNLFKYFESYLKIKQKFDSENEDQIFNGRFDETDCIFVIYTNERGATNNDLIEYSYISKINDLIATGKDGTRPKYTNEDIQLLSKFISKQEIVTLAKHFAFFLNDKVSNNMMKDEYMLRYHVLLAKEVVDVSEIQPEGHRLIKFRHEFLNSTDDFLVILREVLYQEVLAKQKIKNAKHELLSLFITDPSVNTLSNLIGWGMAYKNGKFKLLINTSLDVKKLEQINLPQSVVNEAIEIAGKNILQSSTFKVPTVFGNKDFKINNNRVDRRLNHLTNRIIELIEKSKPSNILILDETMEKDLLELNGGLGSAVGNLLVNDDDEGLFKFAEDCSLLEDNARKLLSKLKSTINDLHKYRLDVRTNKFPKLSFNSNERDTAMVQYFLNRLIFFTEQADETDVEEIVKNEIEHHQDNHYQVKTDAIFLKYHDEIQKFWMLQEEAPYLTKSSNIYYNIVASIANEQLININSTMYINKIKKSKYIFNENALNKIKCMILFPKTIIVAHVTTLTAIKVIQCLDAKQCTVLDIEYLLNLPVRDFSELSTELRNANKENVVIICDNLNITRNLQKRLEKLVQAVESKTITVITNKIYLDIVMKYFPCVDNIVNDDRTNLIDLNRESQEEILKISKIIFQSQEVTLDFLVDEKLARLIEGTVLNDLILGKRIHLGGSLNNSNYDEIQNFYVGRRVATAAKPRQKGTLLQTLLDLSDKIVLITAESGMGKTTLLTHLAINTRKLCKKHWIQRVNLLDHSKTFSEWQKHKTVLNTIEILKFIIQTILRLKTNNLDDFIISLCDNGDAVILQDFTGDDLILFELKMFLHFYNTGNVIFLFDGFDEICPHYMDEVIKLLIVLKDDPRDNKVWITSRPYEELKSNLQKHFNGFYELKRFTETEQDLYINNFFQANLLSQKLNNKQNKNIEDLINFMSVLKDDVDKNITDYYYPLLKIYLLFLNYLINQGHLVTNIDSIQSVCKTIEDTIREDMNGKQRFNFFGIPLHLHSVAEYFLGEIKNDADCNDKWNLRTNTHIMYKRLLITKLKHVRFQDKNNMNIYNPDVIMTYEKELADFVAMHNKLAAFAVFHNICDVIFNRKELEEIKTMIDAIKKGQEKTGLICSVSNDIPVFIHTTFTEHFAVEYLCNILKSEKLNVEVFKTIWYEIHKIMFITNSTNLCVILGTISDTDSELNEVFKRFFNDCENDLRNCDFNKMEHYHTFTYNFISELDDDDSFVKLAEEIGYEELIKGVVERIKAVIEDEKIIESSMNLTSLTEGADGDVLDITSIAKSSEADQLL